MNWDDLRIFLAVARAGSLSRAAQRLGLQHSTVSRRLHKLETALGVRLFDRLATGHVPTPAGARLLARAQRMEQAVLEIDGGLQDEDRIPSGELRVSTVDHLAVPLLMPLLAAFARRYPGIRLELRVSNEDLSLAQREADVAIRLTNTPGETLIGRRVGEVASALYGSRDYLERLAREGGRPEWIGMACCTHHRAWMRRCCGEEPPRLVVDDLLAAQAALRAGLGLAILPCYLGDRDPALARRGPPRPEWRLGLWILMHPDLRHTARVCAFREFMGTALAGVVEQVQAGTGVRRRQEGGSSS